MTNSLQVFNNENFSVRTIRDDNGKIWFVAKDVAETLDYSEKTIASGLNALFQIVPDKWTAKKRIFVRSENGIEQEREVLCLSEQGLYFFLGRSDKPKALPYQLWIADDVVPSIVATGSYSINKGQPALSPGIIESARVIFESAGLKGNQMTLALDKIYRRHMGYSALQSSDIDLVAPENEQLLTPTEIGRQLNLSSHKINDLLAGSGLQHKISGKWEAIGNGVNYSIMLDTNKKHSDGTPVRQLKWKSEVIQIIKGRMYNEDNTCE